MQKLKSRVVFALLGRMFPILLQQCGTSKVVPMDHGHLAAIKVCRAGHHSVLMCRISVKLKHSVTNVTLWFEKSNVFSI